MAVKRDGRNPYGQHEPAEFLGSLTESTRLRLHRALQDKVDRRQAKRALAEHYDRMSRGEHFRDDRPVEIVYLPGGAMTLNVWQDDLATESKAAEQRTAAENEARRQQRADTAESLRSAQEADAEFVRAHTPPGVPTP